MENALRHFLELRDRRVARPSEHLLEEILLISIAGPSAPTRLRFSL